MLGKRGSVMLFLRRLPEGISKKELRAFIQGRVRKLDSRPFSLTTAVCNCSVLCITDPRTGCREYHGLVEIQPAKAAMDAIQVLNDQEFRGHKLEVRRYRHRSLLRDQRRTALERGMENRRHLERRRQNLKIDLVMA